MSGSANPRKVIVAALLGNLAITVCKFVAAGLSKSPATLAEAVHSLADSGNQGLLLLGLTLAKSPPNARFPFGRSGELYFWPFVVALMLFSIGGTFATYEGIRHLVVPSHDVATEIRFTVAGTTVAFSSKLLGYGVLFVSLLFEALSFRVAFREFRMLTAGKPLRRAFFESKDPTIPLVLAEDTTALIGLTVALLALALRDGLGQAFWDPLGSIVIGVLLCAVAIALAKVTHGLLIGESASPEDQALALVEAESVEGVESVTQILTLHLGPESIILALKVAFAPTLNATEIEELTNEIERRIRVREPKLRRIFVEVDAHGDGRGVNEARAHSGSLR